MANVAAVSVAHIQSVSIILVGNEVDVGDIGTRTSFQNFGTFLILGFVIFWSIFETCPDLYGRFHFHVLTWN